MATTMADPSLAAPALDRDAVVGELFGAHRGPLVVAWYAPFVAPD
jgi:hypothetical protein